jgi:K+-transporting ATPase ATPase C chain
MSETRETFYIALRATVVTLVFTGVLYPLGMTGLAELLFPGKAHGSLVSDEKGQVVGSALIGQRFASAAYFQPRPSAAGDAGYDATASSGSNLGPTAKKLRERVAQELVRLRKENPEEKGPVPVDLVTTSGSGLDPHLSPAAALWQVARVARARGIAPERVRVVLTDQIEGRELGFLGEPRVNVLLLNLALDRHFGAPSPGS